MNYKQARKLVIGIIAAFMLFCFMTCFSGCLTAKNLARHNDKFPDSAVSYAARKWPRRDSIGKPKLDSIKKADNVDYTSLIDSIASVSDSTKWWTSDSTVYFDSSGAFIGSYESFIRSSDLLQVQNRKLTEMIAKLRREYKPCKPDSIFFTADHFEVDGPAVTAANLRADKEKQGREKAEKERDDWKTKAKIRFWMLVAMGSIILLFIGMAVGKLLKRASPASMLTDKIK